MQCIVDFWGVCLDAGVPDTFCIYRKVKKKQVERKMKNFKLDKGSKNKEQGNNETAKKL